MQALVNKGGGGDAPKRNQIWYWAASQVTLYTTDNVVSHTFADGKGVVTLDAEVESVARWFRGTPITGVQLPDRTQSIGANAFYQCTSLVNAILPDSITEIAGNSFWNSKIVLAVLPKSLQIIRGNAFRNCPITITELTSGITTIANSAFQNCTSITTLTFLGTPSSIGSSAFGGCTNLTAIRVPWAEGAVSNAPWGATNATIIYNYTPGGQGGFNLTTAVSELGVSGDWLPNGATTTYNGTTYPVYQNGSNYLAMRADGKPHINGNADVSGTSLWRPYIYTLGEEMTASNLSGEWNNPNDDWDATFTFTDL